LSTEGSGRTSGTESVPALVRFGNGLRGIAGGALKVSRLGLVGTTPGGEVRDTLESWDAGGGDDDGTYTSVACGTALGMGTDVGSRDAPDTSSS
jgi:hypothetical protein